MKRVAVVGPLTVFVLLPLGCADTKRTASSAGRSQVWEYKVVQLGKNEERDLTTLLNVYAKDGWEFNGQITTDERHLVFKRPTMSGAFGPVTATRMIRTLPAGRGQTRAATVKTTEVIRGPVDDPNLNRPPE